MDNYDPSKSTIGRIVRSPDFQSIYQAKKDSGLNSTLSARGAFKEYMGGFWLDESKLSIPNINALNYATNQITGAPFAELEMGDDIFTEIIPEFAAEVAGNAKRIYNVAKWAVPLAVAIYLIPQAAEAYNNLRKATNATT